MGEEKQTIDDDAPVPKLPRGKGFALSWPQLMRIGLTLVTLVAIIALRKPCSDSVGRFVTTFGGEAVDPNAAKPESGGVGTAPGPASPATTAPATSSAAAAKAPGATTQAPAAVEPEPEYELMSTSMTDAELRAAFERAKRRAEAAKAKAAAEATSPPASVPPAPAPPSPPKER